MAWSQPDNAPASDRPEQVEKLHSASPTEGSPVEEPRRKPGYAGLGMRQNAEGVVVVAVHPGPLGGDGFKSPSIWRGDLIVSLNGQSLDVAGYLRLVKSLFAGDPLRIVYRRGSADPYAAVPLGDPNGAERSIEIVLDDAARWRGTIGQGLAHHHMIVPAEPGEFEESILRNAEGLGLRGGDGAIDALLLYLADLQRDLLGPNSLPAVAQALERPLALDSVEADIAASVRPLSEPQSLQQSLLALHKLLVRWLDVPDLQWQPDIAERLSTARGKYRQLATSLLQDMRDQTEVSAPDFPQYLGLIRTSPQLLPLSIALLPQVAQHAVELERLARQVSVSPQPIPPELAERVHDAVEGPVLGARLVDGELWIVGGDQPNHYDMDRIAAVFDVGGADVYTWSSPGTAPYQLVIDQAGDDLYESKADFAGPATSAFGVSVLYDRAGNDRYISHRQGSIATGLFGVGILVDEAGNDLYINEKPQAGWSQGAAVYGAGVLIDRSGNDVYQAQILAQGVGGPGGIGLLVDAEGNDNYTANGPDFPSRYETPGVYAGLSQGFGWGIRGYAAGGIGALYDFAGDDRYSVGEFGQGTGYFQGLGILHDASGNDRYVGSRYAQGSGAHQAAGIVVDDSGNDVYQCNGAAAQGAAWDQSAAMLVDREGDDSYSATELAQGSAAQQAVGVLIDRDGRDTYLCSGTCQGESGDNTYQYDASKVFSFSALIDRGGKADSYSRPRPNNAAVRTGTINPVSPASSRCCGMLVDE